MRAPSAGREQDLGICDPLNHSPVPWAPMDKAGLPSDNRTDLIADGQQLHCFPCC